MDKFKYFLIWLGLIVFYFFAELLTPAILNVTNIKNSYIMNISLLLADIIIAGILIFIYKKDFKKDYQNLNKSFKNLFFTTIKVWLLGLVFMIVINNIINLFTTNISSNESINRVVLSELTIYSIPTMVIIGPICEEILFRLSFKKIFKNDILYIILSGIVFGYLHVFGETGLELLYIISYGALGSAFAYLYVKTKNILCPIMAHIMHNLLCIIIILFI